MNPQSVASNPLAPAGAAIGSLGRFLGGAINKGTNALLGAFPKAAGIQPQVKSQYQSPIGPSLPSLMGSVKAKSPTTTPVQQTTTLPTNQQDSTKISTSPNGPGGSAVVTDQLMKPPSPQPVSLPGLLGSIQSTAQGNTAIGQKAEDIAQQYGQKIADVGGQGARFEAGQLTTGTSPVAEGNAAVTAQTTAAQQQALAQGESAALQGTQQALTGQGQAQTGLLGAAGLAPEALRYGAFAGGSGGLDPQSQASQLAQAVTSGQMDFNTASSQMSQYGVAGTSALRNAILSANPNFNFNLSQASAQTQATGQQAQTAIQPANQALDLLQNAYNALPALEQTNVPILNQFTQSASMATGAGRAATSGFQGALQEARTRIDAVLAPLIGVDAAGRQANALLPDNMLPSEVPGKIAAAKTYMQNQVTAYTQSGQQNQNAQSTTTGGSAPAGWL